MLHNIFFQSFLPGSKTLLLLHILCLTLSNEQNVDKSHMSAKPEARKIRQLEQSKMRPQILGVFVPVSTSDFNTPGNDAKRTTHSVSLSPSTQKYYGLRTKHKGTAKPVCASVSKYNLLKTARDIWDNEKHLYREHS